MKHLGIKLKYLRERRKLGQSETAKLAGISKAYYHTLEHSESKAVSADILFKLSEIFGVKIEWFMTPLPKFCTRCAAIFTHRRYYHLSDRLPYLCKNCYNEGTALLKKQAYEFVDWLDEKP